MAALTAFLFIDAEKKIHLIAKFLEWLRFALEPVVTYLTIFTRASTNNVHEVQPCATRATNANNRHSCRMSCSEHLSRQSLSNSLLYAFLLLITIMTTVPSANGSSTSTPYFIVSVNVCNKAETLVHEFDATGSNSSFSLLEGNFSYFQ